MAIERFFQNKKGEWVLYQHPNLLLWMWIVAQAASLFLKNVEPLKAVATMLLFAWAYNEISSGESPFRRVLGGVVLIGILANIFIW